MKYLDEYRDPVTAQRLIAEIHRRATRRWVLMEVCGGQTHGLMRYGIPSELEEVVELIHGPGCPVCVTPLDAIDFAQTLAKNQVDCERKILLTTFGDMLRVPGSRQSLLQAKTEGAQVQIVYSPSDAVELAKRHPEHEVVFFAVGFETTAPATALALKQAIHEGVANFSLLTAHVRVQPAMESIVQSPSNRVQGFLAAGHVCTVMGFESYREFVESFRVPVVVTGFEPLDLLHGILACVEQLESGSAGVENRYSRSVRPQGNSAAQNVVAEVFEVFDSDWRGLGVIPLGGLRLRAPFHPYDARKRFGSSRQPLPQVEPVKCRSAEVLSGLIRPTQCEAFASECSPESPLGAPMVSTEGACAAYYRYRESSES